MATVLHLMPAEQWTALSAQDAIVNPSLATEGFIHCTDDADVLLQVANAFYSAVAGEFVVIYVDTDRLTSTCVWEAPAHISGAGPAFADQFPHVYGPIDQAAVRRVQEVIRSHDGRFVGYGSAVE
jgi:uncharacterized protein (DUF952 family)